MSGVNQSLAKEPDIQWGVYQLERDSSGTDSGLSKLQKAGKDAEAAAEAARLLPPPWPPRWQAMPGEDVQGRAPGARGADGVSS